MVTNVRSNGGSALSCSAGHVLASGRSEVGSRPCLEASLGLGCFVARPGALRGAHVGVLIGVPRGMLPFVWRVSSVSRRGEDIAKAASWNDHPVHRVDPIREVGCVGDLGRPGEAASLVQDRF